MTSALKEIVDRYDKVVGTYVQLLDDDMDLISRARAELERGVYPYDILTDYNHHMRNLTLMPGETASFDMAVDCMARALRDAGVRVVEDGKESSDGK